MNEATQELMECIKQADTMSFFTTETQMVSGSLLLTVLPNIQAEVVKSYRVEFPRIKFAADDELKECEHLPITLLAFIIGFDAFKTLAPRAIQAIKEGKPLRDRLASWKFRLFSERNYWVMEVEELKP